MNATSVSIIIAALFIGGTILITLGGNNAPGGQPVPSANNVSIINGKQIIEINAKGGYTPRTSVAKAGVPTVVRFVTNGTFDCSSFIRIPSMGISKALPQTGVTDIDVGVANAGTLQGMCGMGMYPFEVNFQN
ncbi:MAG: cupredoxin domain-containing protein [Candidatus Kaiserbacteria bacterium]|nr:cupredoxin domain-containing protein [Candidatus Kaiserbacteria bacterium]